MKYLIILIYASITITLFDSCKKESPSAIENNSSSFIGNWELRKVVANIGTKNYASGNGSIFTFTDSTYLTTDTTYLFFFQGMRHKNGHYKIVADTSVNNCTGLIVPSGQFTNIIILDNDTTSGKVFYQITNNTLIILSGYFPLDGGIEMTYEKQ